MTGLLLAPDYDLAIGSEGLQLGEITPQSQALIVQCHKGEFKEHPALGVGISDMLLDDDPLYWRSRIREALELDGQSVLEVRITRDRIDINAQYPNTDRHL